MFRPVESVINFRDCPKCYCEYIDQADYDPSTYDEWYQCSQCGTWYNREGEIDDDNRDW